MADIDRNRGHRKRLLQRFEQVGIDGLQDYEIFELLLSFVIPQCDLKARSKALIEQFKTPGGVISASPEALRKVSGIGPRAVTLIRLINELSSKVLEENIYQRDILSSPEVVRDFCRLKLGGEEREAFMLILLNVKNHVIKYQILGYGTIDYAAVYPREVVKFALENCASGVILIHNHPSGVCDPSSADLEITRTLSSALATVDVKLLDHLIVSRTDYLSFVEKKLI